MDCAAGGNLVFFNKFWLAVKLRGWGERGGQNLNGQMQLKNLKIEC